MQTQCFERGQRFHHMRHKGFMPPKVSVLLPFHDSRRYIARAIVSVLANTLSSFELLLVNDGSTDGSGDIAARYAKRDARVRVIFQPHAGIVAALNRGLAAARADVVARMDADDICLPRRLEEQYRFLCERPEVDLVSCAVAPLSARRLTDGTRRYLAWVNASVTHEDIVRDLYIESPLPHPSVMFRTEAVVGLGGYHDYDGPEDYDLWLRMASAGMIFAKVPEVLVEWRFHGANLTRTDRRYRKGAFLRRKIEYIGDQIAAGKIASRRRIRICGPGQAGKRLNAYLARMGRAAECFIDIQPRPAGATCRNIPVLSPKAIGDNDRECFYFCAVQRWDSWAAVRALFISAGKTEHADYLIL